MRCPYPDSCLGIVNALWSGASRGYAAFGIPWLMTKEDKEFRQGGCLGGKGVRRGDGVFELAAKGSARHLGGSIAALAGYDAVVPIGRAEGNLRGISFLPLP